MTAGTLDGLEGRFLSLTTYRRTGSPVATPVWFAMNGARVWVLTRSDSGKVRRLRNDPAVVVAVCDSKGTVQGRPLRGSGCVLGSRSPMADHFFTQKYGFIWKAWRRLDRLIRRTRRGHDWIYLQIDVDDDQQARPR